MKTLGKLDLSPYQEELENLRPDEQIHVNHVSCPAGEDRKKRLYLKRTDDAYLGYCHHCGQKGYSRATAALWEPPVEHTEGWVDEKGFKTLVGALEEEAPFSHDMSPDNYLYLASYGLEEQVGEYFFERLGNICTVLASGCVIERAVKPKRYRIYKSKDYHPHLPGRFGNEYLVLTEDALSAIKVQMSGYSALPLLGTKLTAAAKVRLMNARVQHIALHLDPDEAGYKAVVEISKELRGMGFKTISNYPMSYQLEAKEIEVDKLTKIYSSIFAAGKETV